MLLCGRRKEAPWCFVEGNRKFICTPVDKTIYEYDLANDPLEQARIELPEKKGPELANGIISWRKSTIFRIEQEKTGKKVLYDHWLCRWTNRVSSAKYMKEGREEKQRRIEAQPHFMSRLLIFINTEATSLPTQRNGQL